MGRHSHRFSIKSGRKAQFPGSIRPCSPSSSRSPQDIGGCPGKENIAPGLFTYFPSPQIEHGSKLAAVDGKSLGREDGLKLTAMDGDSLGRANGILLGNPDGLTIGWQSHRVCSNVG